MHLARKALPLSQFPDVPHSRPSRAVAVGPIVARSVLPEEYRDLLSKCDGLTQDDNALVLCGCEPHEFDVDTETISVRTLVEANDWDLDDCYAIAVGSFGVDFIVYEGRQNLFGLADRDEVKVYRA